MDIVKQLKELALGSRLKRLSDHMMKQASAFYKMNNIDFEAKWFPVFYALTQQSPLSIVQLSEITGMSHPAINQFSKELEQCGLIFSEKSSKDARKRLLSFTPKALELLPQLEQLWLVFSEENLKFLSQQEHNLLLAVEEAEMYWKNYLPNLIENLKNKKMEEVEIIDYAPEFLPQFRDLNVEWISKYFKIEKSDIKQLEHAQENIIDKGGYIFFARYQGEIVGTVGLLKDSDELYELVKMAVSPKVQGKQIGKKLALRAIEKAKAVGAKQIWLESNRVLTPALELYKKVGFTETVLHPSPYARSDIQMIMDL
jgi:DNA-binding MarR family transcriptional regulator/GNAT superfamily N-acetyltransferase